MLAKSIGVVVKMAIGLGTLTALVVSADSISGERERGTLEALLLTPTPRRHLVVGSLPCATTMWIAALLVALPFVVVMADGPAVVVDAVAVLVVAGLVAMALNGVGLAISSVVMSNRVSLALSISILLLLAAPSQLAGDHPVRHPRPDPHQGQSRQCGAYPDRQRPCQAATMV